MKLKLLASLLATTALAACGVDATPQSGGGSANAASGLTTAAQPEKADEAKAEPETKEEGEKKPE